MTSESYISSTEVSELYLPEYDKLSRLLMLDIQGDDSTVVASALTNIGDLVTASHGKKKKKKKKKGGSGSVDIGETSIAVIAITMKRWQENCVVQARCCSCLQALTFEDKDHSLKCAVATTGAIEWITNAMKRFPNDRRVQRCACGVLCNSLSVLETVPSIVKNITRRFVDDMHGLKLVVRAMHYFPNDVKLQSRGCGLISNLSIDDDYHQALMEARVVSALGLAYDNHSDQEKIGRRVRECMKKLLNY